MDAERQRQRGRQYAVCTYALSHERVADGAEAIYDQALSNGLAAIVAHHWPGEEMNRFDGQALAASALLKIIKRHGSDAGGGVMRVLHDPELPEFEQHPTLGKVENFTTVDVPAFREALRVTQAIRHARATGEPGQVLTESHVEALAKLGYHPALFAITDELIERSQAGISEHDATERDRAAAYYRALDDEERERRKAIDYDDAYTWETKRDRSIVEECPVVGYPSKRPWRDPARPERLKSHRVVSVGQSLAAPHKGRRAPLPALPQDASVSSRSPGRCVPCPRPVKWIPHLPCLSRPRARRARPRPGHPGDRHRVLLRVQLPARARARRGTRLPTRYRAVDRPRHGPRRLTGDLHDAGVVGSGIVLDSRPSAVAARGVQPR